MRHASNASLSTWCQILNSLLTSIFQCCELLHMILCQSWSITPSSRPAFSVSMLKYASCASSSPVKTYSLVYRHPIFSTVICFKGLRVHISQMFLAFYHQLRFQGCNLWHILGVFQTQQGFYHHSVDQCCDILKFFLIYSGLIHTSILSVLINTSASSTILLQIHSVVYQHPVIKCCDTLQVLLYSPLIDVCQSHSHVQLFETP